MITAQEERIIRAKAAIEAYAELYGYGGSDDEVISDLIADLAHLTDVLVDEDDEPLDIRHIIECALRNYDYEKVENNV
jgi:hypothetical protein